MQNLTIALDAMGGDYGPLVTIPALKQAVQEFPQVSFAVFGSSNQIMPLLSKYQLSKNPRVKFFASASVIHNDDKPITALRDRRDSSMYLALEYVAQGLAHGCVSAGNTGALVALSRWIIKPLAGVRRPALVSLLPTRSGKTSVMLDLGANPNCGADVLYQFAVMGNVFAQQILSRSTPKIALLNIGQEMIKGNQVVQKASQQLSAVQDLNYCGFVEGNRIFDGDLDVIVCDGFSGNVALKTAEGTADLVLSSIKRVVEKSFWQRWLIKLFMPRLSTHINSLKPSRHNGAVLLGLKGIVIKSHGSANEDAFFQALRQVIEYSDQQIPEKIDAQIQKILAPHS
ncbi:phosphate acyltransferase PlsX [Celerinatantimonas sp. YJH-8]|uniref:phosphate acyltransferase PlsX n=1 Tax=Celerinatantimonas sp. YJH-8 TaxID=3228714 RepID=UPI0038C9D2C8